MHDLEDDIRSRRIHASPVGSLLDAAPLPDDAVLRHAKARAEREARLRAARTDAEPALPPTPDCSDGSEPLLREAQEQPAGVAGDPAPATAEIARVSRHSGRRWSRGGMVALTLAGAALGAVVALAWPESYVATGELLIDPTQVARGDVSQASASAIVDNQLRILQSGTMLGAAAERLNLSADPEFNGESAGFGLGGTLMGLGALLSGGDVTESARRNAVDALSEAIEAERIGGSTVIAVSARSADPEKSALIANTIAELYLADAASLSGGDAGEGGVASERLADLRGELEEAERAVEAFKADNDLVDAEGQLIGDEAILRLRERLSEARSRTVELNARAASTRDANVDSIVTGSLPEQYASTTLTALRARYADQKQQVDRLSVKLGPRHPELLSAQAELESAREEIASELRRVAAALQTQLTRAVQQEQELAAQLAQMKARQGEIGDELVTLRELERQAEIRRSAYEQALRDSQGVGGAIGSSAARMISRAEPPRSAATPSMPLMTLAGALAGLAAGIGLAARRREEVEADETVVVDAEQSRSANDAAEDDPTVEQETSRLEEAADRAARVIDRLDEERHHYDDDSESAGERRWPYADEDEHQARPGAVLPGRNPDRYLRDDDYDHDAFAEDRADAAIEELRQSLREFRDAVEHFAERRELPRRYGT